jgi:hypothetical protein
VLLGAFDSSFAVSAQCAAGSGSFAGAFSGAAAGAPGFAGSAAAFFLHSSTSDVEIIIVSAMSWAERPIFTDFITIPQFTSLETLGAAPTNSSKPAPVMLSNAVRMLEPP